MKSAQIVLIEDNPADASLVRKALETHNVQGEITVVTDGDSAIRFIDNVDSDIVECPDLAIIDLNLPKRSGLEVLEFLRRSAKCGKMPIVILSSSDAQTDKAEAARLRASLYIKKPMRLEQFLNVGAELRLMLGGSMQPD